MSTADEQLDSLLAEFDVRDEPFYEAAVSDAIDEFRKSQCGDTGEPSLNMLAETMAFGFVADYSDEATGWGTYYGPFGVFTTEAGQMIESPSIRCVTPEMLDHWAKRSDEVTHPKLRARYADLVWDFSKTVTGKSADPRYARIAADANLETAGGDHCEHESEAHTRLRRALSLALSIRDTQRIERVRDAILAYARCTGDDDMGGSWGLAFDALIEKKKKVRLTVEQEAEIITGLEEHLDRLSGGATPEQIHPQAAEAGAMLLKRYYLKLKQTEDVYRVLRLFGRAYMQRAKQTAPFVGAGWLKKVYEVYHEQGMKADAEAVSITLREMSEKSADDLSTLSMEFTIPKEEIDAYLSALTEGTLEEALNKIAAQFIPSLDHAEAQLKKMATTSALLTFVTRQLLDKDGRVVAEVGPLSSDPDGHLIQQLAQSIQFMGVWLRMAIESTISDCDATPDAVAKHLFKSQLFDSGSQQLVRTGLKAYFSGEWATAVHLLVPRVEAALRNLVRFGRGPLYRPDRRSRGLRLRNLDDLLRDERTVDCLTERVTKYMQVVLSDPRGLNIRNSVCHGMTDADSFVPAVADRVLHVLLVLALVRVQEVQSGSEA